ncbi:hypothetical protein [Bacillus marinisedimentorum]
MKWIRAVKLMMNATGHMGDRIAAATANSCAAWRDKSHLTADKEEMP